MSQASERRSRVEPLAALAGLAILVAANAIYLSGLGALLDPMISMDSYYMDMARQPLARILATDPGWGPLYALWWKPLLWWFADPLDAYAANLVALSLATTLALYVHVLLLSGRTMLAVAAAWFFLISDFNAPLCNKVSGFALLVLVVGFALAWRAPRGPRRGTALALAIALASYARPELFPAALMLIANGLWQARPQAGDGGRRAWRWPAAGLALLFLLTLTLGSPLYSPHHPADRLGMAFREHFAWNWARWHQEWPYWMSIWEREFGDAGSVAQAFFRNPGAVLHHMADNLGGTLRFLASAAAGHYPVLVPATRPALVLGESLCVAIAAIVVVAWVCLGAQRRRRWWVEYGDFLLAYLVLALCGLSAAVFIYPLPNYLLIPSVVLWLSALLGASQKLPAEPSFSWARLGLAAMLCVAITPRPFLLPSAYAVAGSSFQAQISLFHPNRQLVEFLRALPLPRPTRILTVNDGLGALLGAEFHEVKLWRKGARPLPDYLREEEVGIILKPDEGFDTFHVNDPYWEHLQDDPESAGFARVPIPSHPRVRLYVRRDLIPRTAE